MAPLFISIVDCSTGEPRIQISTDFSITSWLGDFVIDKVRERKSVVFGLDGILGGEVFETLGIRCFVVCPMIGQRRILGALTVGLSHSVRGDEQRNLLLYEELSRRAANAIENSHLYHEAQEAVFLRDEFLSIATHELKNPLTALSLNLQLLEHQLKRRTSSLHLHIQRSRRIFYRLRSSRVGDWPLFWTNCWI